MAFKFQISESKGNMQTTKLEELYLMCGMNIMMLSEPHCYFRDEAEILVLIKNIRYIRRCFYKYVLGARIFQVILQHLHIV